MLLREAMEERLTTSPEQVPSKAGSVRLPQTLKGDSASARLALLQRLAASCLFSRGDRSGVLRSAQVRSGRPFRLDVRQAVIVKALVSRHTGRGVDRAAGLSRHIVYLGRAGAGQEGSRPEFFDRDQDAIDPTGLPAAWVEDRHHFRLIISPEHGDRIDDLKGYVRDVMGRVAADLGQPDLTWMATCHFDTEKPHAHVLVRGRKADGRDLVIPRDYIAYGIRGRAQEAAQERLGDLTRGEAERRIWRQTQADRFTGLDRRLLEAVDTHAEVTDGVGTGPWHALSRGRLRHLERLGLATPIARGYRLHPDLEPTLRRLQLDKDMIRTMHERRMAGSRDVRALGSQPVTGRVVRSGHHDELGSAPFVIVRDVAGVEHYARIRASGSRPEVGQEIQLEATQSGVILHRNAGRNRGAAL